MDNIPQTTAQLNTVNAPGFVQQNQGNTLPTASEISHLWSNYQAESMAVAFLKHMSAKAKDPDFRNVLQFALDISSQRVLSMENLFHSINHPIPAAFGQEDVVIDARELFTEVFCVRYTKFTSKYILVNYCHAYSESTRPDFRELFSGFIDTTKAVIAKADSLLFEKGFSTIQPSIPVPEQVDFVHDKAYFGKIFGSERPLNALEINNLFTIMDYKRTMRAFKLGLAQVTKSNKIRKHLNRGLSMAEKQLQILSSVLEKEGLPAPEVLDYEVTDSQESPYSDRLIMFHVTVMLANIIMAYGRGLTNTARTDLATTFSRLMLEVMEYVKDGVDLLIENGWLERVPEAIKRQEITH